MAKGHSKIGQIVSVILFALSLSWLVFLAGLVTAHYRAFPYPQVREAFQLLKNPLPGLHWAKFRDDRANAVTVHEPEAMMPGLTLYSGFTSDLSQKIAVVDVNGNPIHEWFLTWEELWSDASHLPEAILEQNDKHLHGLQLMPNGDVVFNFSEHGLFRLSLCGEVVWKVPRMAHHSVYWDGEATLWVPGQVLHNAPDPRLPNHRPPFYEFTILQIHADTGEVLSELSVNELFIESNLSGLLYLSNLDNFITKVSNDTLHLNDIDVFPRSMSEGIFKHGDVMLSLRNINTILVFEPESKATRWISVGRVLRQHDPDFLDGNTIAVFDNNNLLEAPFDNSSGERFSQGVQSRIQVISAVEDSSISGDENHPHSAFFTNIMGNHQTLRNGNRIIVESRGGRILEVADDGRLLWEYFNIIEPGFLGNINDALRLPVEYDAKFFHERQQECRS